MIIVPPLKILNKIGDKIKKAVYAKAETRAKIKNADQDIEAFMN